MSVALCDTQEKDLIPFICISTEETSRLDLGETYFVRKSRIAGEYMPVKISGTLEVILRKKHFVVDPEYQGDYNGK